MLSRLHDESFVNVGDHTTTGDGSLDEGVELLVTTDSELQVAGSYAFDLKVLAGVTCQLKNLSSEVLEDSCRVDSRGSTDTGASVNSCLQDSVDSADGELITIVSQKRVVVKQRHK